MLNVLIVKQRKNSSGSQVSLLNILLKHESMFKQQLEVKGRELRVKWCEKCKNALCAYSEAEEKFLWQTGQLGKYSAQARVKVNFKLIVFLALLN